MSANPFNNGTVIGNLARDPKVFLNADGSRTVRFTVCADRDFKNRAGEVEYDAIDVERYVTADVNWESSLYNNIHQGDKVALTTAIRKDVFQDKSGETVYAQKTVVESAKYLSTRAESQARLAKRVENAKVENQAMQTQASQPAPEWAGAPQAEPLPFNQG